MPKAYLVTTYRAIKKPEALAAYAKIAAPAIQAAGGRFLVRGMPAKVYELGMNERTVVVEFESLAKALAAYGAPPTRKRCARSARVRSSATCGWWKAPSSQGAHPPAAERRCGYWFFSFSAKKASTFFQASSAASGR